MKLPCFVINLRDAPQNFEKQRPFLLQEGLDPVRFIGVDGRKDEHLKYKEFITGWCQTTCPKALIGCGLSHVLLARHLRDMGVPMALVLEDDAFPKTSNLLQHIYEAIQDVPEDWNIIKLHCGGCWDGTTKNTGTSTAAYLVSASGIQKMAELKVNFHIDQQMNGSDMVQYKSRYNLFWTDESSSTIRTSNSTWLNYKPKGLSGDQPLSQQFSYPAYRIPGTDIHVLTWHVMLIKFLCLVGVAFVGYRTIQVSK